MQEPRPRNIPPNRTRYQLAQDPLTSSLPTTFASRRPLLFQLLPPYLTLAATFGLKLVSVACNVELLNITYTVSARAGGLCARGPAPDAESRKHRSTRSLVYFIFTPVVFMVLEHRLDIL